jgi:hypothetical protein
MVILRFVRSNQWLGSNLNVCQGLVIIVVVVVVVVVVMVVCGLQALTCGPQVAAASKLESAHNPYFLAI